MTGNRLSAAFDACRPALLRYLRARGADADAEDLLQDLWLKVAAGDGREIGEVTAYLYRMAHNLMLDRVRERQRRAGREATFNALHGEQAVIGGATAERALIARQRLDLIDGVLAALGPRTDMIFRRHRIEQITQQQIAAEIGISLSAVEKHLQKAYRAVAAAQLRFGIEDRPDVGEREPRDGSR